MKILFLISEIKYSGAAKIATWLANKLANHGNQVSFLTFIDGEDKHNLDKKILRIRICEKISNRFIRTARAIIDIHRILITGEYDVLVSFLPLEGMIAVLASTFTDTKVIVSERSDPYHEKSVVADISRCMFRFADAAVFQSKGAKNFYPFSLQNNSVVIANPVVPNQNKFIEYDKRENCIVSASRFEMKQKRHDVLIRAFEIVSRKRPDICLKLYGDGPDEENVRQLVVRLGLTNRVIFAGRSNHVVEEMSSAKVFAFSSDFEGMPNSVLEALSIGVPVVTTDYSPGGAIELIQEKNRGYVVATGDYQRLAEMILRVLDNERDGKEMAENALTVCEELSEDSIIEQWESFLQFVKYK